MRDCDATTAPRYTLPHAATHMCAVPVHSSNATVLLVAGDAHVSAVWADDLTQQQQHAASAAAAASAQQRLAQTTSPSSSFALTRGAVTALHAAVLPTATADTALAVAGTSAGTLCAFLVRGVELARLCELSLLPPASTADAADEDDGVAVVDVRVVMDGAGRPECVVAATATSLVVVRVWRLLQLCEQTDSRGGGGARDSRAEMQRNSDTDNNDDDEDGDDGVFVSVFADAALVRVLVPERPQQYAAFDADVVAVLVFANGTLRYVQRQWRRRRGVHGAVHAELPRRRAQTSSDDGYDEYDDDKDEEEQMATRQQCEAMMAAAVATMTLSHTTLRHALRTLPRVVYRYAVSDVRLRVCDGDGDDDGVVAVHDATLVYNASTGRIDMLLAGACSSTVTTTTAATAADAGGARPLCAARQHRGWWAYARNVVLPRDTLQPLRVREAHARGVVAAVDADGVSAHTIHVRSTTVALQPVAAKAVAAQRCCGDNGNKDDNNEDDDKDEDGVHTRSLGGRQLPSCGGGGDAAQHVDCVACSSSGLSSVTVLPQHAVVLFTCGADVYACTLRSCVSAAAVAATRSLYDDKDDGGGDVECNGAMAAAAAMATRTSPLPPLHLVHAGSDVVESMVCVSLLSSSSSHSTRRCMTTDVGNTDGAAAVLLGAGTSLVMLPV